MTLFAYFTEPECCAWIDAWLALRAFPERIQPG